MFLAFCILMWVVIVVGFAILLYPQIVIWILNKFDK